MGGGFEVGYGVFLWTGLGFEVFSCVYGRGVVYKVVLSRKVELVWLRLVIWLFS